MVIGDLTSPAAHAVAISVVFYYMQVARSNAPKWGEGLLSNLPLYMHVPKVPWVVGSTLIYIYRSIIRIELCCSAHAELLLISMQYIGKSNFLGLLAI